MAKTNIVSIGSITQFGNRLAQSLRGNLQWSKQLRNSVTVEKGIQNGTTTSITVTVGGKGMDKSGMPLSGMAEAYEFGSGEHRTKGLAQKYIIKARLQPYLVFQSPGYASPFIGKSVMHPGVAQREYMSKSIQATLPKAIPELALDIRKNLVGEINAVIREINQK